MNATPTWYIDQRAEALARVLLTRRSDIVVKRQDDTGIDLLVEILQDTHATAHVFGVHIQARATAFSDALHIKMNNKEGVTRITQSFYPVCLFYFTMEDNKAFYRWIIEPITINHETPKLRYNDATSLMLLDSVALERIIKQVQVWYDALSVALLS